MDGFKRGIRAQNTTVRREIAAICDRIFQVSFDKHTFPESELQSDHYNFGRIELKRALADLSEERVITLSRDRIEVQNRLHLAEILLKAGRSVESLSKLLSWREFEQFCRNVLEANGFLVRSNIRFIRARKRYEIDLIAVKSPHLLFIDCKHWKPGARSGYRAAARKQRIRMEAALEKESVIGINWVAGLSSLQRISLIVALADVTDLSFEGMPVVPIFRFNSFLMGLDQFWDHFSVQSMGDDTLENWTDS